MSYDEIMFEVTTKYNRLNKFIAHAAYFRPRWIFSTDVYTILKMYTVYHKPYDGSTDTVPPSSFDRLYGFPIETCEGENIIRLVLEV